MKKQQAWVIYSEKHGVYLGSFIGLGFWSREDTVGQAHCACFRSPDEAAGCVSGWEGSPDDISYRQVMVEDPAQGASIAECVEAVLPAWFPEEHT